MKRDENGFSLVEILISVAILGILCTGIIWALGTGVRTLSGADETDTARSIAEGQMEYIKSLPFISDGVYPEISISPALSGYSIDVTSSAITGRDSNLQHLTVVVKYQGKAVISLEGYKVQP